MERYHLILVSLPSMAALCGYMWFSIKPLGDLPHPNNHLPPKAYLMGEMEEDE